MPGQLVPVENGRRLNLVCLGEGAPTVVLESGLWGDRWAWRKVQARIAGFTRACAYDRAGYGFSDANDRPVTGANVVDDLRSLIGAAGLGPRVVLVGHSLGGLYAALYADLHPDEVAGMVLVDPVWAGQINQVKDGAVGWPHEVRVKAEEIRGGTLAWLGDCLALARAGDAKAAKAKRCRAGELKVQEQSLAEMAAWQPRPGEALGALEAEELAAARPLGDMPIVVLTAGVKPDDPDFSPKINALTHENARLAHERLAARSSRGRAVVVAGAGHMIQSEKPAAVVEAVREVVEAARARRVN